MKGLTSKKATVCWIIIFVCALILSFLRIGTGKAPDSVWQTEKEGTEILLDFGEEKDVRAIVYYLGNYGNRQLSLETGDDESIQWTSHGDLVMHQVYQWRMVPMQTTCRFFKLTTQNVYTQIGELLFLDRNGEILLPVNTYEYPELFDETYMYKRKVSYETGTVFDEPVYARTAFEYLNGMRPFEDTHPPMGKLLIAPGIALFGMNPVGWRFMGTIAGVFMLVLIAAFAKKMFDNPWISVGVAAIFAFDFMHFTHTRLAHPDSFLVLFMMGMFYFMYCYGEDLLMNGYQAKRTELYRSLLFSGICMGMAISCKWSGAYGALGLALLWLGYTSCSYRRKLIHACELVRLVFWCVLCFVLVPIAIYLISYIPYIPVDETMGYWDGMIQNQINMFKYHTSVPAEHAIGAKWFQWPLIANPITYSFLELDGVRECVFLLGNPAFWFAGLGAFFYCVYCLLEGKDRKAAVLVTMYLSPLLPWILVPRSSFLYHYFPCLPALALMLGYYAERWGRRGVKLLAVLAAVCLVLFVIFYPILSGLPVPAEYVEWLEWLPWWEFS